MGVKIKDNNQLGIILMVIGIFLLVFNSVDYLFYWHKVPSAVAAVGIVFLAVGVALTKRN